MDRKLQATKSGNQERNGKDTAQNGYYNRFWIHESKVKEAYHVLYSVYLYEVKIWMLFPGSECLW